MADHPFMQEVLAGWQVYQDDLVKAVRPLTGEQLNLRLAADLRSAMTLAAHIIAARVWWLRIVMHEGSADVEPLLNWDEEGEPSRSAAELVDGLERTWAIIASGLQQWTAADMGEVFYRPGSDQTYSYTRQWIIWHVLEHDLHHGGELSFLLGAHGVPAISL